MEEECTAIVPVRRIERKEVVEYGGSCKVKWSNDRIYHAFLLFSGMYLFYNCIFIEVMYEIGVLNSGSGMEWNQSGCMPVTNFTIIY